MNVFELRDNLIADYQSYIKSKDIIHAYQFVCAQIIRFFVHMRYHIYKKPVFLYISLLIYIENLKFYIYACK